eukprot:1136852-Pelagomonas_calceolata.AAC.7
MPQALALGLYSSLFPIPQFMGVAAHVTPARLHGRHPASCHISSTFSVAQHMSERVLCPSAAWGCIMGPTDEVLDI